jgi:hypothetical protein
MGTNQDPPHYESPIVRWWEQKLPVAPEKPVADEEREPRDINGDDSPVNDSSRTA